MQQSVAQIIQSLRAEARRLNAAADFLEGKGQPEGLTFKVPDGILNADAGKRLSRIEQIQELLKSRGPLRASEIIKFGGIPRGTLAACLKTKNGFKKNKEGKWIFP
jgi:hypothetical protein